MTLEEVAANGNVDLSKAALDEDTNTYYFFEATYDVTNNATFRMPTSGASGNWLAEYAGIVVLAGALTILFVQQRRRRKA